MRCEKSGIECVRSYNIRFRHGANPRSAILALPYRPSMHALLTARQHIKRQRNLDGTEGGLRLQQDPAMGADGAPFDLPRRDARADEFLRPRARWHQHRASVGRCCESEDGDARTRPRHDAGDREAEQHFRCDPAVLCRLHRHERAIEQQPRAFLADEEAAVDVQYLVRQLASFH